MSLHYEALGVSEDVTLEDLRAAWRAAARRWHPDHGGGVGAEAMFKRASDAWAVLRDTDLRAAYDEALRVARTPTCSVCGNPSFQPVCVLCSVSFAAGGARAAGARQSPRAKVPARPVTPNPPPRAKPRPPVQPNPPPRPRAARPARSLDPGLGPEYEAPRARTGAGPGAGFGATPGDAWDAAERALFEREVREREEVEEMERDAEEREAAMRESASALSALMGGKPRRKRSKPLSLEVPLGPGFRIVIDEDAAERMGDVNDGLRLASRLFRSVSKFWNR